MTPDPIFEQNLLYIFQLILSYFLEEAKYYFGPEAQNPRSSRWAGLQA